MCVCVCVCSHPSAHVGCREGVQRENKFIVGDHPLVRYPLFPYNILTTSTHIGSYFGSHMEQ